MIVVTLYNVRPPSRCRNADEEQENEVLFCRTMHGVMSRPPPVTCKHRY